VIKTMTAPMRSIVRFPLVQLIVVIIVIVWLQAADDISAFGQIFNGLDKLVATSVNFVSEFFTVKSFTRAWLTSGFMIAYVYLALLLIIALARVSITAAIDFAGRNNVFWLRNTIARERGIAAYRAWVPFERIRPTHISQYQWEETYAWPADDKPPYRPLAQRIALGLLVYTGMILLVAVLLQLFTPLPVLTWLRQLTRMLVG
jgi:hypothetical protein